MVIWRFLFFDLAVELGEFVRDVGDLCQAIQRGLVIHVLAAGRVLQL